METLESQIALHSETNTLVELSVQQVVSCDKENKGCGGGMYTTAWDDYIKSAGGLNTASEYPYDNKTSLGSASKCDPDLSAAPYEGSAPSSYMWATEPCTKLFFCPNQDEDTMKANLLSYGPLSIAVDASQWAAYTGGVLTSSSCSSSTLKQDHAVQLVGFNATSDSKYWIVRNSWGVDWGNDGYIYLQMGGNTCGVADKPAVVLLA